MWKPSGCCGQVVLHHLGQLAGVVEIGHQVVVRAAPPGVGRAAAVSRRRGFVAGQQRHGAAALGQGLGHGPANALGAAAHQGA